MRRFVQIVLAVVVAMVCVLPAAAQDVTAPGTHQTKRLILKDGSYQLIKKYEVLPDRVRYYSAERYQWEEVPKELVDWDATKKFEESKETAIDALQRKLKEQLEKERQAEEQRSPTVAPGIRLPDKGGVLLLDQFGGKPQLVEIEQNGSEIKKDTARNILRAALNPVVISKQPIVLKETKARVQAHALQPVFYVNLDPEQDDEERETAATARPESDQGLVALEQRYRIVKAETKKGSRVIGNLRLAITGMKQQQELVDTKVEVMTGGWVKITPSQPLPAGEYALVEMLGKNQINLYVWDFGVNPAAPRNTSSWTPEKPPTPTGTAESPVLQPRKK